MPQVCASGVSNASQFEPVILTSDAADHASCRTAAAWHSSKHRGSVFEGASAVASIFAAPATGGLSLAGLGSAFMGGGSPSG
jgi:hypothetical protein